MPVTETRWARRSSAEAWNRSLIWRSSRSRPTNGASSPSDLSAPRAPETTRTARHSRMRPVLALQLVRAGVLVDDRRLGRPPGRLADEHLARLGPRLDPRGGVDDVAGDHPLALGADRHRRLAGHHAGPGAQVGDANLVAERGHRGDQVERGPHGPLGVVLGRVGVPQTAITASPMNFSTVPP